MWEKEERNERRENDKAKYKSVRRKLTTLWSGRKNDKTKYKDTVKAV